MKPAFVPFSAVLAAGATLLLAQQTPERFPRLTAEQAEILSHLSLVDHDDGFGNTVRTLRVSGLDVQIVNGLGTSTSTNGAGNLILGYGETNVIDLDRRGSHNLVLGPRNSYASYGALLGGERNRSEAPFASVTAGSDNRASAPYAAVHGGTDNHARDAWSVVLAGVWNESFGGASAVVGGEHNSTAAYAATVVGGRFNSATADVSTVHGGESNLASAPSSSVSGGFSRTAAGEHDWAAGALVEDQ